MGAVNLKIERPSSRELSILPDPPGSGYYTKGYLVQDPTQPGTYVPTGLVENGSGLYNVPPVAYTGYNTDNLKDYSVVEDATTINASTYSGGFGQLTVPINQESPDIIRVINDTATLSDPVMGKITGTVRNLQNSDGDVTVVADSILGLFNADKVVAPFTGTLYDAFSYYCQVAEIPIELVVVDLYDENDNLIDDVANRPVTFPGWVGNMWDHLKEILVSQQLEMSQVFDQVYVRPLRQIVANTDRNRSFGWAIDNQTASRQIQMNYYPTQRLVDGEFYPTPGEDATVYQVDAGEIMSFTLQLPHSLEYVNQPDCVDFVENRPYPNTNGVYSVAGNDGLPVTAAQWKAQGGNLTVRLTDDPSVVEVTITGASDAEMAPYRIAMTSGEFYNSLHLTGTGLFQEEKSVLIHTGATSAVTGDDIGVVVQNRNIQTLGQALTLGAKVAGSYALAYTISGEAFNLNRADASRDAIVAVVKDLDAYNSLNIPGADERLSDFNTLWTSFPQFDQFWLDYVDGIYENQAFGNAAGARVLTPDSNFRIDNATLTPAGISYSGSLDTIISDYDEAWIPEGAGSVNGINYHPTPRGTSTTLWGYQLGTGETAATALVTEATVKRTNLVKDPRGTAFWSGSAVTYQTTGGPSGVPTWVKKTLTATGTGAFQTISQSNGLTNFCVVQPGVTYHASADIIHSHTPGNRVSPYLTWYDAAGAQLGQSVPSLTPEANGQWYTITASFTAPAGAAYARLGVSVGTDAGWPVGAYIGASKFMMLDSAGAQVSTVYFDGFSPDSAWTGAANNSTSTQAGADGPLLPDGTRMGTYVRRTVTALKTGGSSGPWCRTPNGSVTTSPGVTVVPTMYARFSVSVPVTVQSTVRNGSTGVGAALVTLTVPAGQWVRLGQAVTATGSGDNTQVWATLTSTTILPVGTTVDTTGGMTTYGSALVPYFDGSSLPYDGYTYRWAGAANNSASERLIAFPPLDTIDENWGAGTTVNDFSLASLRRNI